MTRTFLLRRTSKIELQPELNLALGLRRDDPPEVGLPKRPPDRGKQRRIGQVEYPGAELQELSFSNYNLLLHREIKILDRRIPNRALSNTRALVRYQRLCAAGGEHIRECPLASGRLSSAIRSGRCPCWPPACSSIRRYPIWLWLHVIGGREFQPIVEALLRAELWIRHHNLGRHRENRVGARPLLHDPAPRTACEWERIAIIKRDASCTT